MDSMRSLNTSLPGGTSPLKQQTSEPPEELLSAFKATALSVTKLYKTAAANQVRARAEGYQDALDELLSFLDKENIGLSDGEGWRIRRWATERLDGRDSSSHNDSDDEVPEKPERPSSPLTSRTQSSTNLPTTTVRPTRTASPVRVEQAPPQPPAAVTPSPESATNPTLPQSAFTFRSSHSYPQDTDILLSDLDLSDKDRSQSHSRANVRHNNHASRLNARPSNSIGRGAGQKRKINFGEFFDIGNLGHGRDRDTTGGGGKRGRFV
ncbi:adaptor complexes medium subunit family protein [Rutstroemia sp. NJR-2017a BBW]|nr:adaptor complexes medium subunit family protein [Rutstroemia sp. NJR-2017a BBW]